MDGGQEVGGEAIVTGCDAPEVLETTEHAFDGIPVAAEVGRNAGLTDAIGLWRDVGHGALGFGQPTDLIAVIALVGMQDPAWWKIVQ